MDNYTIVEVPKNYNECLICLEKLEKPPVVRMNCCSHVYLYHKACIDRWIEEHAKCPICKSPLHRPNSRQLQAIRQPNPQVIRQQERWVENFQANNPERFNRNDANIVSPSQNLITQYINILHNNSQQAYSLRLPVYENSVFSGLIRDISSSCNDYLDSIDMVGDGCCFGKGNFFHGKTGYIRCQAFLGIVSRLEDSFDWYRLLLYIRDFFRGSILSENHHINFTVRKRNHSLSTFLISCFASDIIYAKLLLPHFNLINEELSQCITFVDFHSSSKDVKAIRSLIVKKLSTATLTF